MNFNLFIYKIKTITETQKIYIHLNPHTKIHILNIYIYIFLKIHILNIYESWKQLPPHTLGINMLPSFYLLILFNIYTVQKAHLIKCARLYNLCCTVINWEPFFVNAINASSYHMYPIIWYFSFLTKDRHFQGNHTI